MSILNLIAGRSGLNSYSGTRNFSTMGVEKMKSGYHSNENYNFLDTFAVPHEIKNDKQFIKVNGLNNQHLKNQQKNSSNQPFEHKNLINLKNLQNTCMEQPKENYQEIFIIDIPQLGEMTVDDTKTNPPVQETKLNCNNQLKKTKKKSRKKNKQKHFTKKSKRESDRNICSTSSNVKRKNKNSHKKSIKMEFIEMDLSELSCSMQAPDLNKISLSGMCLITSPIENNNKPNVKMPNFNEGVASNKSQPECDTSEDSFVVFEESDLNDAKSEDQVDFCISIRATPNKFKPRLLSDCDSEDSFILFQDNSQLINDKNKSDICISIKTKPNFRSRLPSECESEDSFIVFDNCTHESDDDESCYDSSAQDDSDDESIVFCSKSLRRQSSVIERHKSKKVHFAKDEKLCTVHPMIKWSFAYRKARKSPWEQMALDRSRFENRVNRLKVILDPILRASHRNEIYKERFQDDCK